MSEGELSIAFVAKNPAATALAVEELERRVGTLPAEYREFLLSADGGQPEPNVDQEHQECGVSEFFSIQAAIEQRDKLRGRVPSDFLPIASAAGGNLVCLRIRGEDVGSVYFWDHELEPASGESVVGMNMYRIAASVGEFLAHLRPLRSDELPKSEVIEAWIDPEFLSRQS